MRTAISAWVESPLQLLGAIEHAALVDDGPLTIVPRGGDAQLEHTAAHLAERVSRGGSSTTGIALDRRIMPRNAFSSGSPWLIGDPFSGQVQLRLDRAEPSAVTLVDDGAITRVIAEQLQAAAPMLRPQRSRLLPALRRELARRTTRRLLHLADRGRLAMTTFLPQHDPAVAGLQRLGATVITHRFDATRRLGERAIALPPGARVVLGTAGLADGLADAPAELRRVALLARSGPLAYLPHRREPRWFSTAVGRLPDVVVVTPRLPIELALAGTDHPLDVIVARSTAAETLPIVLRGTGSTVRFDPAVCEVGS